MLGEGLTGGEVGERSEGGEGVADAEKEVAVAEVPEVLTVVVKVPGGASENLSGGEFEEDGVGYAILVILGLIPEAWDEAVDDEGDKKVLVVNVMQREHRTATEQKLSGDGLKAEAVEGDTERRLRAAHEPGGCPEKKKGQPATDEALKCRNGGLGNRHGTGRVLLHYQ
jgi:hypothetical protein